MLSKISNSEIGSSHWLNTLLGTILHIGEYMQDHPILTPTQHQNYGKFCYENAREILDWFSVNHVEAIETTEKELLKKLKQKYENTPT